MSRREAKGDEARGDEARGKKKEERNAPQHEVHFLLYEVDIKD